ncbi:hypothetical protein AAE478_008585 [Parahypoxylon ruwenzoriense]
MQGDIFQLEHVASQAHATPLEPSLVPQDSRSAPQVAIYNEDDLSHLLYANHLHHHGRKDRVIINRGYQGGSELPGSPPTGTQTPLSETNETPVLSDCESDWDEGVYPNPPYRVSECLSSRNPAKTIEDGSEFPVFLGRQMEESSFKTAQAPSTRSRSDLGSQSKPVRTAGPEKDHVSDISGPLMSWWPEPVELMEHEWVVEDKVVGSKNTNVMPSQQQVSNISGSLMSWWPVQLDLLEHEWDERFYE